MTYTNYKPLFSLRDFLFLLSMVAWIFVAVKSKILAKLYNPSPRIKAMDIKTCNKKIGEGYLRPKKWKNLNKIRLESILL